MEHLKEKNKKGPNLDDGIKVLSWDSNLLIVYLENKELNIKKTHDS